MIKILMAMVGLVALGFGINEYNAYSLRAECQKYLSHYVSVWKDLGELGISPTDPGMDERFQMISNSGGKGVEAVCANTTEEANRSITEGFVKAMDVRAKYYNDKVTKRLEEAGMLPPNPQ